TVVIERLRRGFAEIFLRRGVVRTDHRLSCFAENLVGQGAEEGRLAGVIDNVRGRNTVKQKGREGRLKLHGIVPNLPAPAALLPSIELLGKLFFQRQRRRLSAADRLFALRDHEKAYLR